MLDLLAREAVRELNEIRRPPLKEKAKAWGKGLLGRGNALGRDPAFWPAGLLLLGLLEAEQTAAVSSYVNEWVRKGCVVQNPDDALFGAVLLELYEETGQKEYAEAARRIASYLRDCLRDEAGSIIYGQRSGNSWIYADGAGMTALFLSRYTRVLGNGELPSRRYEVSAWGGSRQGNPRKEEEAADLQGADDQGEVFPESAPPRPAEQARRQLSNFAAYGMDARSGLPYHGYDLESGVKLGIIGWGRAVGWLLMGLSEYVMDLALTGENRKQTSDAADAKGQEEALNLKTDEIPCGSDDAGRTRADGERSENRKIIGMTRTICAAVVDRIRPDGLLSWQLDCVEGPADTSASAMIFWSLLRMNRFRKAHPELPASVRDLVPYTDPAIFDAAAEGLRRCVSEDGKVWYCSGECVDFAQYRQQYGNYAWGQGSALAFLGLYDLK